MNEKVKAKIKKLPKTPGVYFFKDKRGKILYVGKAASLASRTRAYFRKNQKFERPIEFVMELVFDLEVEKTDSVIEAYFLEQEMIRKHKPKYNVMGKDDKSFVYVCVTREDFPRFEIKRKTDLENENGLKKSYQKIYGPFDAKHIVEKSLRILQKIFPYHARKQKTEKYCLDFQIGLCPGPFLGKISKRDYLKNIRAIEKIFQGRKKTLIKNLEKEMREFSRKEDFEGAIEKRNQIFSLRHIQDLAIISAGENWNFSRGADRIFRVEGYDISNLGGKFSTGSMAVFDDSGGEFSPNKKEYRRFKIKTISGADDPASMREVLRRRFGNDWPRPDLLLVDGGEVHLKIASQVLKELSLKILVLAVAKGPERKKLDLRIWEPETEVSFVWDINLKSEDTLKIKNEKVRRFLEDKNLIARVRDEAHRFAVSYHRKLRRATLDLG